MVSTAENNKRIAKNTLLLYIRMFVMMFTALFTSRIVLQILGEVDYGIYNIIGGVVILFSFLNSALLSATQRFLNFHLGQKDTEGAHKVFCMSMNCYFILSIIFIILGETIGLWFIETQMNIPANRMYATYWVYQFSLMTFIVNLIRVPYNATIISYERMNFYSYLSIAEIVLKLLVVYLLYITSYDKLIFYSFLYFLIPAFITYLYKVYCNYYFKISCYKRFWDKNIFYRLFSFSGWSLLGSSANLFASQGLNILVNIFYGVTINTALGIANQLSTNVYNFISNFQIAFNPQIVKRYAAQEMKSLYNLMFSCSKLSYFLLLIVVLPIILNVNLILDVWLLNVPDYTAVFSQLILCFFLIEALSAPLWMFVQATGKIRDYQILMSILIFLNFPIIYLVLKLGFPVYFVWIVRIMVNVFVFFVRCLYIKKVFDFPLKDYCFKVIFPIVLITIIDLPVSYLIKNLVIGYWSQFIISTLFAVNFTLILVCIFGLNRKEKEIALGLVKTKFRIK